MRSVLLFMVTVLGSVVLLAGCNNCSLTVQEEDRKSFDGAVEDLLTACADGLVEHVLVGECANNNMLLIFRFVSPFRQRFDYYDGETGAFVGREESQSDVPPFLPCLYQYWPAPVDCENPTVTEVLCGTGDRVGDALLDLPFF